VFEGRDVSGGGCALFNKDRKTIAKMLRHELPPGYQRSEPPRRPTLDGLVGVID